MSDSCDNLKCGNCGYDGGRAHMEEKLQWQKNLAAASKVSDSVREVRAWVLGIATVLCTGIIAIGVYNTLPTPPKTDADVWSTAVSNSYAKCASTVSNLDRSEQSRALQGCNDAFKDSMRNQVKSEE